MKAGELRELGVDRFARFVPLEEDGEIVALLRQRTREVAILLEAPAALQNLLRFGLVFPEIRFCGSCLEPVQFLSGTCGLKDNSAYRRSVSSDPDSA